MRYRLPPMNSLRAFEAAARHLSFSRAAEEIALSQGAVSRHISILEDYLGVPLFQRKHREVALTEFGADYFRSIQKSLDIINEETAHINRKRIEHPLRIKSLPTFATKWLVPRLGEFAVLHPEIDIAMTTFHDRADFSSGDIDCSIEYGIECSSGLVWDLLFHVNLTPVSAPRLADDRPPPAGLASLKGYNLLHSVYRPDLWCRWLTEAGYPGAGSMKGTVLQDSALVYQAAVDGLGIAIAELPYVLKDIEAGRLVAPFDCVLRGPEAYYLVYPREKLREKPFATFRKWTLAKAELSRMAVGDTA